MATAEAPLVSVITPFYEAAPFIEHAIASVGGQTYSNWELILVDDGSGDGGSEIARAATNSVADIHYLEHPGHAHRGVSASRNAGAAVARGDLIALLDADDLFLPTKLERQVAALQAHPAAGMVIANTLFWHSPDLEAA